MMNPGSVLIIRHSLGCGTIGGIYTAQFFHVKHFIGLTPGSLAYLFAVAAFYFILYATLARWFRLNSEKHYQHMHYFKMSLLGFNLMLSIIEYWMAGKFNIQALPEVLPQVVFSFFGVLFTEMLLPIILGIGIAAPETSNQQTNEFKN